MFDFDKILQAGSKAVESVKDTAVDLAGKGKKQVDLVNEQAKLAKAQRQLGALVYSLHVNGEENQPLVDRYIQAIADIEAAIEELKLADTDLDIPAEEVEFTEAPAEEAGTGKKFCTQCGGEVDGDALFCGHCGAQL